MRRWRPTRGGEGGWCMEGGLGCRMVIECGVASDGDAAWEANEGR